MLIRHPIQINYEQKTKEDKILIVDQSRLAIVFFDKDKYILYNFINNQIEKTISIKHAYSMCMWSSLLALTAHTSENLVSVTNIMTGEVKDVVKYQYSAYMAYLIVISDRAFGLLYHLYPKKTLVIYDDRLKMKRTLKCEGVVEQYSSDQLISYNQIRQFLQYTLIDQEKQQKHTFETFETSTKIVMKIIQKSSSEIIIVYTQSNNSIFQVFNIHTEQRHRIFEFEEKFIDLVLHDNRRDLFLVETWRIGFQSPNQILVKEAGSKQQPQKIPYKNGTISKNLRVNNNIFINENLEGSSEVISLNLYKLIATKNMMIYLMVKLGVIDQFGTQIVKKVLSVVEYV